MEKMRFEQFTKEVVEKIREYLPETFATASVELQTVRKNNDLKLTGLTIRSAESNISPTIYLESFFQKYQDGEDMSSVLENIADVRLRHEVGDVFDVEQITDFERVKGKIVPRLVGTKWNEELLKDRPHTDIADLSVTYHILLGQDGDGTASVAVTNSLMDSWNTDVEELHRLALRNMPVLLPSTFQSMSEVLGSLLGDAFADEGTDTISYVDDKMFVLSNKHKVNGAAALLDPEIMQNILNRFGENFYILPSSVHEVLIVKADSDMDPDTLTAMVQDVNECQVAPDERLSDHVYRYTADEGLCSI